MMMFDAQGLAVKDIVEIAGMGTIGAGYILRQVFNFMEGRKNGNSKNGDSGHLPPQFWLEQFEKNRQANVDAITAAMAPMAQGFVRMEDTLKEIEKNTIALRMWDELKDRRRGQGA